MQNTLKPKIAIISTNADLAGAPRHVSDIVRHMRDHYEILTIFGEEGPIAEECRKSGATVLVLNDLRSKISPITDTRTVFRLAKLLMKEKVDLVHAHSSKAGLVGRLAARMAGVPFIFTVHGWGFGEQRSPLQSAVVRVSELCTRPFVSHYVAVSEADRRQGILEIGIDPARIITIRNGRERSRETAEPDKSTAIVMVARAENKQKDFDTLARAVAVKNFPGEIWLVGAGTDSEDFKAAFSQAAGPAAEKVRFMGESDNVPHILSQAGIFCLSSLYEGMPLSIIEAMAAGLPVVATDVGGVAELVAPGENGYVVPVRDEFALRDRLLELLADAPKRLRFGQEGMRRFIKDHTVDKMISEIDLIYDRVLLRASANNGLGRSRSLTLETSG